MANNKQIDALLSRGVEEIIVEKELREKLASGKKLRVKHGVDPTSKNLHIGHAVVYWKLKEFQDLGHTIVFLIGGFTARFGDPTDKEEARQMRTKEEVEQEADNYLNQVGKILDLKKTEVRYNSEWYDKMSAEELLRIMSRFTVARMLERDMFQERMKKKLDIGLHEIVYPVLQGYDSVALKDDLTVCGNDQKFNELQARPLQKAYKQIPQDIVTVPMLPGTDGRPMGQSLQNFISLADSADEMFGKSMSISDDLILSYFDLAARASNEKLDQVDAALAGGENPRDVKLDLAEAITKLYHGDKEAKRAREEFLKIFAKKEKPTDIPEVSLESGQLIDLVVNAKLASSKGEARRLIEQGAVRFDDKVIKDWRAEVEVKKGMIMQVGKRKFVKIA
ncbi:tyrosine--tRNA ligase [Patescibacteria group bacterium]